MSESLTTALTNGFNSLSTNIMDVLGTALPVGLGIAATIIGIRVGWKFIKSFTRG